MANDLKRNDYLAEMAICIADHFEYHRQDAEFEAQVALEDFEKFEVSYGDDAFAWDREAAREHAFNWIEGMRRQKYA